ncbi:MAG: MFS transporter [Planctomycetota bacterium]
MAPAAQPLPEQRRKVLAWCCYDVANSGYTTLMITVFAVYMQRIVFDSETTGATGAVVWAWSVALSMLIGAIASPLVGAIADGRGAKREGLAITALGGGIACMIMAVLPASQFILVTVCFVVANLCLELSLTFYNGFLAEISDDAEVNRISTMGMAWGYFGGGLALLLALLALAFFPNESSPGSTLRVCVFGTGVWWILFSIPTIWVLDDRPRAEPKTGLTKTVGSSLADVWLTIKELRHHRTLAIFLVAFLFYNDGVQTVISQSSTFAIRELNFSNQNLAAVVLLVQFVATPGAMFIGWLSDQFGRQRTLQICLVAWIVLLMLAWFVETQFGYWLLSIGVALVLGGTQSVSRAVMSSLTPEGKEARYFGFFNFSGKATSFMGTFYFGMIIGLTQNARIAIVGLILFFSIGLVLLSSVRWNEESD